MAPQKKTVLIVEDEEAVRKVLFNEISSFDIEVQTAPDGKQGLDAALKTHPDLILLDLLMPEMDGITMMKKLREDTWGKTAPIVILTNFDTDDKVLGEVVKHEPAYYLVKSNWEIANVVLKVRETLGLS